MGVMGNSPDDNDAEVRMIGKMWGTGSSLKSQKLRTHRVWRDSNHLGVSNLLMYESLAQRIRAPQKRGTAGGFG